MSEGSRRLKLGDSRQLLHRILDQPNLVAAVQALPPRVLGKVVAHVGLEDAGEIVALATTSQLAGIFDDDLWTSAGPGKDETFDADRFALWLEVMLEAGETFAANKLAELPEDLVTLAFHRQILVINIEELAIAMSGRAGGDPLDEDGLVEKALESCLAEELGEYRIIARRHESWDTLFGLLVALDRDHHEFLERLLGRLCALDAELIEEDGGLYQVLTAEESLEADVAGEREDRRTEQGFIAPSSAAAFLALARTSTLEALAAARERDAVTRAYFRGLGDQPMRDAESETSPAAPARKPSTAGGLDDVLREAGIVSSAPAARLLSAARSGDESDTFAEAVRGIAGSAPSIHLDRVRELAYLANVLAVGCSLEGRPMRPVEAARAAVTTCNLGLTHLLAGKTARDLACRMVEDTTADKLFLLGWNILFRTVVVPTAEKVQQILARAADGETDRSTKVELDRAAAAMGAAVVAGRPWTARRKLEVLEDRLEPAVLSAVVALLGECPTLAGTLSSLGTGEIEFIATRAQVGAARQLVEEFSD